MQSIAHRAQRRRRTGSVALATMLILLLGHVPALAQEPQEPEEIDRWAAAAELTLTDASGNQDLTVITTGFTIRHRRTELFALELQLEARYGSRDNERVAESYKGSFNFDFSPGGDWSPFLFTTAEHDPFKRLDVRFNSGAGAKYRIHRAENGDEASVSMGVLHSYEALRGDAASAPTPTQSARWNLRVNGQTLLREGVTLSHRTQYQPVHDRLGDYLLSMNTALKVLVNSRIALSISHEYNRDTSPAANVGADDRLLKAGVIVEL